MSRIKQKMGYCPLCGNTEPKPIVGGYCQYHYWDLRKKPIITKPKKISPFSEKHLAELKKYRILRDKFLPQNPICMFPGCESTEVLLHHAAGRVGKLLTNSKYFRSLCDPHHKWVELNPIEAKKMGLSVDRTNKISLK